MKVNALLGFLAFAAMVLFSYSTANAQNEVKTKDVVTKTADNVANPAKPATKTVVEPTNKHAVVVTDNLTSTTDKTNDATTSTGSSVKTKSQTIGKTTITVTDNVVGQTYEGGKWLNVTSWDGTKWVSKREWFPNKKN